MEKNIDWVSENLRPSGYNMICTDGFMSMTNDLNVNAQGYMTHYAGIKLTDLVQMCKDKGLKLGVYDNPLWVHAPLTTVIEGYNKRLSDLVYEPCKGQSC